MPSGAVLLVIAVALIINVVVMAAIVLPPLIGRRSPLASVGEPETDLRELEKVDQAALIGGLVGRPGEDRATYDRIVRIVSWAFLLVTAVIVGASGLWPDTTPGIFVLLGVAGAFVLLVHDLLPPASLGAAKYVLEGTVAITFATFLVLLTGGYDSPFFFTFPLIVGAAALVVRPTATFLLAIAAAVGYLVSTTLGSDAPSAVQVATVAIDLTALFLLAYVGSVIGREQRRSRDAALRLSAVDPLTGLFNRAFFFAALEREMARSARSGRGFCLLMLDLDELKAINDDAGHHAGDAVLRAIADTIRGGIRRIDVAARYGGDEFVALLPETDPTGGWVLAEKIRLGVAALRIEDLVQRPTVSIGVVAFPRDGGTADALMISADRAMYASKRSGRNRVAGPTSEIGEPELEASPGVPAGRGEVVEPPV
ncbi:MAG TPA: GGDEF domain-containing protein [Candidatus Limnocylindrales bacterium]|nr:GGDEF domain-containing protein [Candidatus Limnocylindrales bacterium]